MRRKVVLYPNLHFKEDHPITMRFCEWLREKMDWNGVGPTELSKILGINRSTIHRHLKGAIFPTRYHFYKYVKELSIDDWDERVYLYYEFARLEYEVPPRECFYPF